MNHEKLFVVQSKTINNSTFLVKNDKFFTFFQKIDNFSCIILKYILFLAFLYVVFPTYKLKYKYYLKTYS